MDTAGSKILRMVIITCVGMIAMAAFVAMIIYGSAAVREASTQSTFTQYQAAAQLFKGRIGDYKGVCSELVLAAGTRCRDSVDAFIVSQALASDSFYCTDATGFTGLVASIAPNSLHCQK